MVTSIINLILGVIALGYAVLTSRYVLPIVVMLGVLVAEVFENGLVHSPWLVLGEVVLAILVMKETKGRKGESPLLKYNPMYRDSKLPNAIRIVFCSVMLIAVLIRVADFFWGTSNRGETCHRKDSRDEKIGYIKEIVKTYKNGGDYCKVAANNPFTNCAFTCRYVRVLVSEYNRLEELKRRIKTVKVSSRNECLEKLERLSAECLSQSTNVLKRIDAANIGAKNAEQMKKEFSSEYLLLRSKCE